MTQVTPPGWYPDPGQTSEGPPTERWWDGSVWTEQTRAAGSNAVWGPPAYPPGAPAPDQRRKKKARAAIGAVVALVVLAGIGGGVYALTAGDDGSDGKDRAAVEPSPDASSPGGRGDTPREPGTPGTPPPSGMPSVPPSEDGFATDAASGISLPVPDGWTGQSGYVGAEVSTGQYKCPGDTSTQCVRGGVFSAPAAALKLTQTTSEAVAKADIEKNAEESYGGEAYGKISSHDELESKAVTVAGAKGYLVRWKVVTSTGDDGYVESLAFPSPTNKERIVLVRSGFDVSDKAPKLSVMDEIREGIKKAPAGAGNGQEA
ncbi:DUF2510 domain-containing protein [Streptomyces sp. NPDC058001]|uniref:DUF2510 domain-containing protein n=1 Tax=Streptomyces sp. NPDC058001 TaxID=3346300 RepID=UPI0036E4BB5D